MVSALRVILFALASLIMFFASLTLDSTEALFDFLEVVEKEAYANIISCIGSFTQVGLVALFAIQFDADLVVCGRVVVVTSGTRRACRGAYRRALVEGLARRVVAVVAGDGTRGPVTGVVGDQVTVVGTYARGVVPGRRTVDEKGAGA